MKNIKKRAFSLAELIVAMAIIGVVTAIVLPTLQLNAQEYSLKIKRKVFASRISQAIPTIANLKGYSSASDFVTNGLKNALSLRLVCDSDKLFACDLPQMLQATDGSMVAMPTSWSELNPKVTNLNYEDESTGKVYRYSQDDSDSVSAITDNGESLNIFYNPACSSDAPTYVTGYYAPRSVCLNMIFDLNGVLPPNRVGKDIGFVTVFRPTDSNVVAITPDFEDLETSAQADTQQKCRQKSSSLRVPTDYELATLFINEKLLPLTDTYYWSATVNSSESAWYLWEKTGIITRTGKNRDEALDMRCVSKY